MTFSELLIAVGIVVVAIMMVTMAIINGNKRDAFEVECKAKCKIIQSKVIEGKCYCASDTGFIVPEGTFPLEEL